MSDSRVRLQSLALVVLLCGSVTAFAVPAGATTQSSFTFQESGNTSTDPTFQTSSGETFAVNQGGTCYEVTPLGDGSKTISDAYNWSVDNSYSSAGTSALQENQTSNLFIYNGKDGYSLVLLHDKKGNSPYGSTITMNFTGLPSDGKWAVRDDYYGDGTDDDWNIETTSTHVDWKWQRHRTDGGAYHGLLTADSLSLTVDPEFNDEANHWGDWPYSQNEHRINEWRLFTDSETTRTLDMETNLTITRGSCDATSPTAALSATPTNASVNESVTFDASSSDDNTRVSSYQWDFDGDGTTDETTSESTTSHVYGTADSYTASVTVSDPAGNTDMATTSVTVTEKPDSGTPPTAALDAPATTTVGTSVTLDASASSDEDGIATYQWDVDGDGTVDANTTAATFETEYDQSGTVEPTVTVVDTTGENATATAAIEVTDESSADTEPPTADIVVPETVVVNESVTILAENITDESEITHVCWYVDGETGPDGRTLEANFSTVGTHTVSVMLKDSAGNSDKLTKEFQVVEEESEGTDGSDGSDGTDGSDGSDGTDGSDGSDGTDGSDGSDGTDDSDESDSGENSDNSDSANVDVGEGGMADFTGRTPELFEDENEEQSANDNESVQSNLTVETIELNASTFSLNEVINATVTFSGTGNVTDDYSLNLTVFRTDTNGTNETTVNKTQIHISSGKQQTSTATMLFDEPGQYRAAIGNRSTSFTVSNETIDSEGTPTATPTGSTDDQPMSGKTTAPSTAAEPADDTNATATSTSSPSDETTTSSDGPGFSVVIGLVALVLSMAALGRQH